MPDLLQRVHAEIAERLAASRAAVAESARLQEALAALGDHHQPPPAAGARRRRRTRSARPGRPRAARGANRAAVLAALAERPGATVGELAAASGVPRRALYTLLRRLAERGEVTKRDLPGGTTGYALASETQQR